LKIKISTYTRQTETVTTSVIKRDMKGYVEVPVEVNADEGGSSPYGGNQ